MNQTFCLILSLLLISKLMLSTSSNTYDHRELRRRRRRKPIVVAQTTDRTVVMTDSVILKSEAFLLDMGPLLLSDGDSYLLAAFHQVYASIYQGTDLQDASIVNRVQSGRHQYLIVCITHMGTDSLAAHLNTRRLRRKREKIMTGDRSSKALKTNQTVTTTQSQVSVADGDVGGAPMSLLNERLAGAGLNVKLMLSVPESICEQGDMVPAPPSPTVLNAPTTIAPLGPSITPTPRLPPTQLTPSASPTLNHNKPSKSPTIVRPSKAPSASTPSPVGSKSRQPTRKPTTKTRSPTARNPLISNRPTIKPSNSYNPILPTQSNPTLQPVSFAPSTPPFAVPSSSAPSNVGLPSNTPSIAPSESPTISPSDSPSLSDSPSYPPSQSASPTFSPSASPSLSDSPSFTPSQTPSLSPSLSPSDSPSLGPPDWDTLGSSVNGENKGTVSLSYDGYTLASVFLHCRTNAPCVKLFNYNVTAGYNATDGNMTDWLQMGNDIFPATKGFVVDSVALSGDGTTIAVATTNSATSTTTPEFAVQVYAVPDLQPIGDPIITSMSYSATFVTQVSLSHNASQLSFVITSETGTGSFALQNYQMSTEGSWQQFGTNLTRETTASAVISSDGFTVAVLAFSYSHIFHLNTDGLWEDRMNGLPTGFFYKVALNENGLVLATRTLSPTQRKLEIFTFEDGTWSLNGTVYASDFFEPNMGYQLALSADGTMVTVATFRDYPSTVSCAQAISRDDTGKWHPKGRPPCVEQFSHSAFGSYMSLSSDGLMMAIGDDGDFLNATDQGHIHMFQYAPRHVV